MAGTGDLTNGLTVIFHDENGNPTGRQLSGRFSWFTGRANTDPVPGTSSKEWIREVYLADTEGKLYTLISRFKPTGLHPLGSSGANKFSLIHYFDNNGNPTEEEGPYVIAQGVPDNANSVLIINKLKVSPVPIVEGNILLEEWNEAIIKMQELVP